MIPKSWNQNVFKLPNTANIKKLFGPKNNLVNLDTGMTHVEKIEIEIMIEFTQDEKDKMKKEQAWLQITIPSFYVRFLTDVLSAL